MRKAAHKPPRSEAQQQLLLGLLVGAAMVLITGLYAFTLRYQDVTLNAEDMPRWSVLADGVVTRAAPLKSTLLDVKDKLASISKANQEHAAAIAALKAKIASGSATTTPEAESASETENETP